MSSRAASDLNRILMGSAIGAAIGLVLLALGVAILWNAADQRLATESPAAPTSAAPVAAVADDPGAEATASSIPYPAVAPPPKPRPAAPEVERPRAPAASGWRSIFEDEERAETRAPAPPPPARPEAPSRAAPPAAASRPAPKSAPARRPPEAQRQADSLFF